MKFLQNLAVEEGDWGRFVHFSEEHFSWKDEVGGVSEEQNNVRKTFYEKLGKDKQKIQKKEKTPVKK